jgi:hypothetical protein
MLRIIWRSCMHRMHVRLLISIPVGLVLMRILRHHRSHMLLIIWLILVMLPHGRWYGCVRAIVPPLRSLHGHGMLPIRIVV